METNKVCPNCNQPVEDGATFCGNCGQKITPGEPPIVTASPIVTSSEISPEPSKPATPVVGGGGGEPVYSIAKPETSAEKRSIVALVTGVVAIPASLVPIVGLVLGVAGLAMATTARIRYKHTLNLLAMIFSGLAIIASLGMWVRAVNQDHKTYAQTGPLVSITSPCYSVKVDTGRANYKHRGCTFSTSDRTEEFDVVAVKNKLVTSANLAAIGARSLAVGAASSGGKISGGHMGTFAGSVAYLANYASTKKGTSGVFAFVLHVTPNGDNIFIVGRAVLGNGLDSFGSLETTWQWK